MIAQLVGRKREDDPLEELTSREREVLEESGLAGRPDPGQTPYFQVPSG